MYSFILYGKPGVGKSSLAAKLSNLAIFDFERGYKFIKPESGAVFNIKSIQEFRATVKDVIESGQFKNVVIDSLTNLEKLIHKEILAESGAKTLATALGGYGAAYKEAVARLQKVHDFLDEHFRVVLYVGHCTQRLAPNPFGENYEQYTIQLDNKAQEHIYTLVDGVYYMTQEFVVVDDKAKTTSRRVIITKDNEACLCKDRLSLNSVCTVDDLITALNKL